MGDGWQKLVLLNLKQHFFPMGLVFGRVFIDLDCIFHFWNFFRDRGINLKYTYKRVANIFLQNAYVLLWKEKCPNIFHSKAKTSQKVIRAYFCALTDQSRFCKSSAYFNIFWCFGINFCDILKFFAKFRSQNSFTILDIIEYSSEITFANFFSFGEALNDVTFSFPAAKYWVECWS